MIIRAKINDLLCNSIVPDIENLNIIQISTNGCSLSEFYNIADKFFLKINDTAADWLSLRSNDIGREVLILSYLQNSKLWAIFDNPYIALAKEGRRYGILMKNLNGFLFDKAYSSAEMNNSALKNLAKMHSVFWGNKELEKASYLLDLKGYFKILGIWDGFSNTEQPIGKSILKGWVKVRQLIPQKTLEYLLNFETNANEFSDLPRTLIHGDYRPTNLGFNKNTNKLTVIDFAFAGFAPCTVDLYWYLATSSWYGVNIEESITLYRNYLEHEIGKIEEVIWQRLCTVGVISVCYMQLWEKALDYEYNNDDFEKWLNRLNKALLMVKQEIIY